MACCGATTRLLSQAKRSHSRFVQRIRRRYHTELALLPPGPPTAAAMRQTLAALQAAGLDTAAALRVLRHLVLERLAVLDVEHGAPLALVTGAMTDLAELALDTALQVALSELDEVHGLSLIHI